jgi:hypothetical protein
MQRKSTSSERTSTRNTPAAAPIGVEVLGMDVIVKSFVSFPGQGIEIVNITAS